MLIQASKFFIWLAIASPLIASKHFFFPFIAPKALFFRIMVEISLMMLGAAFIKGELSWQDIKIKIKSPLMATMGIFTALFLISCAFAANPAYGFWSNFERGEGGWQIIHYFLLFIILTLTHATKKEWHRLIGWQIIISLAVGLYAVLQVFQAPFSWLVNPSGPISGPLGNPSYLGWYMLISIFLTLWLATETNDKTHKTYRLYKSYMLLAILIFQLIIFITAKSRGSFAALGIGLLFITLWWFLKNKHNKKILLRSIGIISIIILSTILSMSSIKGGSAGIEYAWHNFQPRLWTWNTALKGTLEKPLLGWGAEHFNLVFDRYYDPRHDAVQPWFDRAHNTFFEYATTGGIPLLLAYLGLFIMFYKTITQSSKNKSWLILAALPIIYLVNSLILFEILPIYIMLVLILALGNAHTQSDTANPSLPSMQYTIFFYVTLIPLIAITTASLYYTAYLPYQKNKLMLAASQKTTGSDIEIFMAHDTALKAQSPIGQEEALQNLLVFAATYWNYLKKNNVMSEVPKEKRTQIISFLDTWYEKEKDNAVGVRTLYLYAATLILEMEVSGDREYRARAEALIREGKEKAPNRLELTRLAAALKEL